MAKPTATTVDESVLWKKLDALAADAIAFADTFLGLRKGTGTLTATDRARLLTIGRAVSWVESKHGTVGANYPERDAIQCGNPNDAWWKELTGQSGNGSRFIRGGGLSALWAKEVAAAAEATAGFNSDASMSKLGDKKKGHKDPAFAHAHSFVWGVIYLCHRTNTPTGNPAYQCGDLSRTRLVKGAVKYNGGGDAAYRGKIEAALRLIGDLSET